MHPSSDPALDSVVTCAQAVAPTSDVCLALRDDEMTSLLRIVSGRGALAETLINAANAAAEAGADPLAGLHHATGESDAAATALSSLVLRSGRIAGVLVVTGGARLDERDRAILRALADQASLAVENGRIYEEAQRSFNNLFIAYEAGRLFNFSHGLDDVLDNIKAILSRALHYPHYAVLLREGDDLVPGITAGLAEAWREGGPARLPVEQSFARLVMEEGAAVQTADQATLAGLTLPLMENGTRPAVVLCAPMTTRAGTLGVIELYDPLPHRYSSDEEFLFSVLANEAASAVENARLYESLRDKESRLTMFAQKLVHSQEEERKRMARDIHDGLAQMIVAAYRYLQAYQYTHRDDDFVQGLNLLNECITESRKVMSDLRPSVLDDFGLILTLEQYVEALAQETGCQAEFVVEGGLERLSPVLETTIFRLVQEALTNVRKHAASARLLVRLERRAEEVQILVRDWGMGFDPQAPRPADDRTSHLGLVGMRERVTLVGGSFSLRSVPGEGTTVAITLPLEKGT